MTSYQDCLEWLFNQLPMYQRSGQMAYKADIGNIEYACQRLENPHHKFKSIHIAGTNGKGSTSHMMASILQEAGYKTGLYTSPHLKDFRERIRIDGQLISQEDVLAFVAKHKAWFSELGMSFFEMTVALAFNYFAEQKVDIAIIETGLGGRLDSTNIIKPEISVITNIGFDHTALLGKTLQKIAVEKAGIIKQNTPVLIGRKQEEISHIFEDLATKKNAQIFYAEKGHYTCDLKGDYQKENISTAYSAIRILEQRGWKISEDNYKNGFLNIQKNTSLLGRWTTLSTRPLTICDTGHNIDGINRIVQQLRDIDFNCLHFVIGVVNDKSIDSILELLPKKAIYYFCQAKIPRAMPAMELSKKALNVDLKGQTYRSVKDALIAAQSTANNDDLIFIGGSTFTVAEIL